MPNRSSGRCEYFICFVCSLILNLACLTGERTILPNENLLKNKRYFYRNAEKNCTIFHLFVGMDCSSENTSRFALTNNDSSLCKQNLVHGQNISDIEFMPIV